MDISSISGIFACSTPGYVSYEFRNGTMRVLDEDDVYTAESFNFYPITRTVVARVLATGRANTWNYNFTFSTSWDCIESGSIRQSAITDPEGHSLELELFYGEKNGKLVYTKQA